VAKKCCCSVALAQQNITSSRTVTLTHCQVEGRQCQAEDT